MAPLRTLLVLLCSGLLLAAGNSELIEPSVAEARERWEQSNVENYRFFYKLQCFCVGPAAEGVFVTVIGGRVVNVELENTAATTLDFQSFDTIDSLFDQISKYDPDTVYSFSAKFDPDLGFPVEFFVDIHHMMADEEWGFIVNGFTIIE
jgi:hypothetical protein